MDTSPNNSQSQWITPMKFLDNSQWIALNGFLTGNQAVLLAPSIMPNLLYIDIFI